MNILSVYCHHEPSSLTSSLKNIATSTLLSAGHQVVEDDLYASGFETKADRYDFTVLSGDHFNYMLEQRYAAKNGLAFAPDIQAEIQKVMKADLIIIHTPIWWLSVPALLKGWFDRVLAMGITWDGGKIYEKGLLRGKTAMLCVVAGGPAEFFSPEGKHRATIDQILHPIHQGTLAFCGLNVIRPFVVFNSLGLNASERARVLTDYRMYIEQILKMPDYITKY